MASSCPRSLILSVIEVGRMNMGTSQMVYAASQAMYATVAHTIFDTGPAPPGKAKKKILLIASIGSAMRSQGKKRPFLNWMRSIRTPNKGSFTASHTFVMNRITATDAAVMPMSE